MVNVNHSGSIGHAEIGVIDLGRLNFPGLLPEKNSVLQVVGAIFIGAIAYRLVAWVTK